MKIAICDDEQEFLTDLNLLLNKIFLEMNMEVSILKFTDARELLYYTKEHMSIDIIFMDILMGEVNGFEIAKKISLLKLNAKIIFLSSTSAYAIKGYDIKAARYLVKPIKKEKLSYVINDIIKDIQMENNNYIIEKNDKGIHKIFLKEIIYIETCGRKTMIHTLEECILSYRSMKNHEVKLNRNFIRCHSSYIVNMKHIKGYKGYEIYLLNGDKIWVSKNKRKEFLYALTNYYGKQLK